MAFLESLIEQRDTKSRQSHEAVIFGKAVEGEMVIVSKRKINGGEYAVRLRLT